MPHRMSKRQALVKRVLLDSSGLGLCHRTRQRSKVDPRLRGACWRANEVGCMCVVNSSTEAWPWDLSRLCDNAGTFIIRL